MSLTRHTRRMAALTCLIVALTACKAELYTGLTEREANEMVAALVGAGIPASKSGNGGTLTVTVDDARFADAMAVLDARGLPARQYDSMGDVFKKEGLVSSPTEERARLVYALSQELSRTIAEIDGVLSARIHVVLPESDMLGRDVKPSSASVFLRYAPDSDVADYSAQIKLLVANSIEGLLYDNITVVMVPAARPAPAPDAPALTQVLGLWLHPASTGRLWTILGGMAALALAALALAGWPLLRAQLARRRNATLSGAEAAAPPHDEGRA